MLAEATIEQAAALLVSLRRRGLSLVTAESCTGGLIAAALTAVPGASDVVDRGHVTYSNAAKTEMLGVSSALIADKGAVSAEVARAMAVGALEKSTAAVAVAVTGIAGPGGGSGAKPIGLVHLAVAMGTRVVHEERRFGDLGRDGIRSATVAAAFALIERVIDDAAL
ncbi:MAG: CinA family protein [Hyphomicrobiaceae bacterium]|nr:CinA family protein [Hyphomicrobiaceae bacterium]